MEHFSWFTLLGLDKYDYILGSILVLLFLTYAGFKITKKLSKEGSVLPDEKFSLTTIFEILTIDFLFDLFTNVLGSSEQAKKYFPLLGASFFFIMFANLLGSIPGFLPPTGNFNTTVACALVIFVMYNYYGFKENGLSYIKHFAGPVIFLAPLMFVIELISHFVRPLSLSLRLFMNITGDHLVLGVFTNLIHYIIPAIFVGLGIFVALLQAFIFTVLSAIYISLATSHETEIE
ncbi:MAG: F0F1 ATP synthase subunit A [Candidatus Dadabacteria bacterium]|jgi:F-type H+-transporting ATPase subunit a|nr:F0F1 ATP synthase subunit A [Candidatus Dadabacteria bacterium]MCZ6468348.1 F0F1 ATP synthase subunit A [Candidatus Dadabacteria bacterium]MCZ6527168.1 F0F1 ATP synthase subunit A [Candidatus Dadabacteria bacterium]MCZ6555549.1 F0F1 ATP synthase subunit A [Candidatus Dadabacteria bacterium]MCZ6639227.1 F0F1 ATP synthase subunit A [Candidatus Dadabacteria bacterium]